MGNERRVAEASGLRRLFQEQWNLITGLWQAREERRRRERAQEQREKSAVESIVEGTDARLRILIGYQRSLRSAARGVLDHVQQIAELLPEPLPISPDRFVPDPHVNAFFTDREEIVTVLGCNQQLRGFYRDHSDMNALAHLLLMMTRREKRVFGIETANDQLRHESLQTTVSFDDHRVLSPSLDEKSVRRELMRHLFDSLVEYVSQRMLRWRYGADDLKTISALPSRDPKSYLEELVRLLESPADLMRIEQSCVRVSKMGIKIEGDTNQATNDLTLHELALGDLPPKILILATYPRSAMAE